MGNEESVFGFAFVQQRLQPNLSRVWWAHLFPPVALLLLLIPLFKLDAPSFLVWPVVLLVDVLAIGLALFTASLVSVAVVLLLTMLVTACWIMKVPAVLTGWTGLLAPAGTPRDIVDKLQKEIAARLLVPETRESLASQGAEPVASTPEQFTAFIRTEMAKWSAVIRQAGLEASQ